MNNHVRFLIGRLKQHIDSVGVVFCLVTGSAIAAGFSISENSAPRFGPSECALIVQTLVLALLYYSKRLGQRRAQQQFEHLALRNRKVEAHNVRLRNLINAASQVAVITTDAHGRTLLFSGGAEQMFGFSRDELLGSHALDLLRASEQVVPHYVNPGNVGLATQWRYRRKDGSDFIGELRRAETIDADSGEVEHINVIIDVSERVALQEKVNDAQTFLKLLTQNIPNVLYQYHLLEAGDSYFSYCSPSLQQVFELAPEEVVGVRFSESPLFKRVHHGDLAMIHAATAESIRTGESWACDFRVILPKAGTRWLRGDSYAEKQGNGTHVWYGSFIDITELKDREKALRVQAVTDELTGIYNRRYFMERLAQQVELARRYGHTFSLIMLDLDHFKSINDQWGHEGGDRVLREACELIARRLRSNDVFCRVGGEELAILCPYTAASQATALAETLRQALADQVMLPERQVTASFGVACWDESMSGQALLRQADEAMYSAKRDGRNRVHLAGL